MYGKKFKFQTILKQIMLKQHIRYSDKNVILINEKKTTLV